MVLADQSIARTNHVVSGQGNAVSLTDELPARCGTKPQLQQVQPRLTGQ